MTKLVLSIIVFVLALYSIFNNIESQESQIYTVEQQVNTNITLEDIEKLSEKGHNLDWNDFNKYSYTDIGSGLHIYEYEIDDNYQLLVGGVTDSEPLYIKLVHLETEDYIDIRDGGVKEFIKQHS